MKGYIKDHRRELESDIWLMPPLYHRVWQWLKYKANHEDREIPMKDGSRLLIRRGQHLTSLRQIAQGVGWYEGMKWKEPNPKTISSILSWMEKQQMIRVERGNGNRQYTLITLLNWDLYQMKDDEGNSKETARKQSEKQQTDINKNDYINNKEMMIDDDRPITPLPHPEEKIGPNWEASWRVGEYFAQRCGRGLHVRESDRFEIEQLLDKGVPEREILYWIDECFKRKKGSTINSFRYIATVIEDERRKREQQKSNKVTPLRRRNQPKEDFSDLPKAIRRQMEREARGEDYESEEDPKLKAEIMEELYRMRQRFEEKRAGGQ